MRLKRAFYGVLLAGILAAVGGCADTPVARQNAGTADVATQPAGDFIQARMVIIVRHADIDVATKKAMGAQAPLTARGQERAKELAYALKDAGITRIITSETLRTQQTAQVLANELHLDLDTPFGHGGKQMTAEEYAASRKNEGVNVVKYLEQSSKPGEVILLVHHHSVIPGIMKGLGYEEPPIVEDEEFDRVYVVIPQPADHTYKILRLRYGGNWSGK